MKDRLQELMKHSGGEFYEGFAGSPNSISFKEDDLVRFTELIVKECIDTLNWHGVDNGVPYIEWMAKAKLGVMK
jgi:hypothetical protein